MQSLTGIDQYIFIIYIIAMILFGIWIANREKSATASDYFLASRSLPWWAVGGSLIASNISAEQVIGMNGSGFELGLAIATYELMAAITLIIVAKFLLPVFIKKEIYTMPQFLEERFDGTVRTVMSVFWIILFVFVNIATVLYLGALAIEQLVNVPWVVETFGGDVGTYTPAELSSLGLKIGIVFLVLYSACFSIFGGLKAVVWTDVIQVAVLLIGGTAAAYGILTYVGDGSLFGGIGRLFEVVPDHFEMLFEPQDTYVDTQSGDTKSSFELLPGFALLFGGMWIVNTYYWGTNQYIIQRALASTSLAEAQKGVAFAALMKLFIPFFAVLPGIAAFYLLQQGEDVAIAKADQAFPWVLANHVGPGLRGLTFAALVAAIGSSISSMVNSASTIFTIDIYNTYIDRGASQQKQVRVGQISAAAALVLGAFVAPALADAGQVFQIIQEYTGFVSPGVLVVFLFGMFYRKATSAAALAVVIGGIPLSMLFKALIPGLPFLDRMTLVFLISVAVMILVSAITKKTGKRASDDTVLDDASAEAPATWQSSGLLIPDSRLRLGLAIGIIGTGLATALRLLLQPVPGVPLWATILFTVLSLGVIFLLLTDKQKDDYKAIDLEPSLFRTSAGFNVTAVAVLVILAGIYATLG